ncbi:MAG: condensation domain-containing protein, partial [Vicinamibacterales bacterium]
MPIAIIGLSGYLPGCMSVAEFWRALDEDRPLIEEIPRHRFDWRGVYDPSGSDPAKSHTKWGGFIPEIETFDRELFRMSRADAERADPRLRLLLMSVYNTLEDAGYAPRSLARSATGVFVAVEDEEYLQTLAEAGMAPVEPFTHAPSAVASGISAFFDFRGASEIVNTMCSGAAVALHRAVLAIRAGEIDQAIVGAANLMLRPDLFVALSRLQQLSPCETVKSFGEGAAGYLRAEGVASVLLKPLPRAEADGDPIYATIRASAVNFNGPGGPSTAAPDVASHADLMLSCYTRGGIDPASLTYIEAQGMGNQVADIAEWDACNRALERLAALGGAELPPGHCRVSTVKPMIGHMHAASALGAVFKILRSFQTGRIHRIIGFEVPNRFLDLRDQPCRLADTTEAWPRTAVPRLAALHSYGAGGSTAHLVLEEYPGSRSASPVPPALPSLLPLSAGTEALRVQMAERLLASLDEESSWSLDAVAHTLQRGRDHMRYRVAFVAESVAALQQQLRAYCSDGTVAGVYHGDANLCEPRSAGGQSPGREAETPIGRLHRLAREWAAGSTRALDSIGGAVGPQLRAHVPVYPFDKQRYWAGDRARGSEPAGRRLDHPLFNLQRFGEDAASCRVRLDGVDFFLADHCVTQRKILPAAAYLELARTAAAAGRKTPVTTFTDLAWQRALVVDGASAELDLELVREDNGDAHVTFSAPARANAPRVVHGRGTLSGRPVPPRSAVDLAAIARRCGAVVTAETLYARLARAGFGYGPRFRAVQECRFGDTHLLARVALPPGLPLEPGVVLHPSLIDAALQSAVLLHLTLTDSGNDAEGAAAPPLPYSIDEIVIHGPLPREFVVHSRTSPASSARSLVLDSDVCSYTGEVLVSVHGLYLRSDQSEDKRVAGTPGQASSHPRIALEQLVWVESGPAPGAVAHDSGAELKRIRLRLGSHLDIPDGDLVSVDALPPDEALVKVCEALVHRLRAGMAADVHGRYLFEVWCDRSLPSAACDGIVSFLKSIRSEHPHVQGRVLRLDSDGRERNPAPEVLRAILATEHADARMPPEVAYKDGRRYIRQAVPLGSLDRAHAARLAARGQCYCVIGGGILGGQLATFLVERLGARVILASRTAGAQPGSPADPPGDAGGVTYVALDVTDRDAVDRFVARLEHADIEGMFFTAGRLRPGVTLEKTAAEMREVIAPKASGALNLLRHCGRLSCGFVALFSSRASRGAHRNADYAAANGFLNGLALEFGPGEPPPFLNRHGRRVSLISIDWPHWEAGGMHLAPDLVDLLREREGLAPLPATAGFEALRDIARSSAQHVAVAYREIAPSPRAVPAAASSQPSGVAAGVGQALRHAIGHTVGMSPSTVDMDATFAALGLTSISVVHASVALREEHGIRVRPSAFFEHGTPRALEQHILKALGADVTTHEALVAHEEGGLAKAEAQQKLREPQHGRGIRLSEGQIGLWALQRTTPAMTAYNVPLLYRAIGSIDAERLRRAWTGVLERFPLLASTVQVEEGVPRFVTGPCHVEVELVARRDVSDAELIASLREELKRPIDPARGPLARCLVVSRGERDHVLMFSMHHLVVDGGSVSPLMAALAESYRRPDMRDEAAESALRAAYEAFADWEQDFVASEAGRTCREYWSQRLAGHPTLELPSDRRRLAVQVFDGASVSRPLAPALVRGLRSFAESHRVSLATVFLSLYQAVLCRYARQDDLVVGVPTPIRPREAVDALVGYYVNAIPVRTRGVGSHTFESLVKDVHVALLEGLEHAQYPLPRLVRDLHVERTSDRAPLVQTTFAFTSQSRASASVELSDDEGRVVRLEPIDDLHQEGAFELELDVRCDTDACVVTFKYQTALFDADTIEHLAGHYVRLADLVLECPSRPLREHSILTGEERQTVLHAWNATAGPYPDDSCVHHLIDARARRTPGAVAVACEERRLTYRELEERSSEIARGLRALGLGRGSLVGVCLERSLDMVVGLLAILKAGAAYVPLDPEYPDDRLAGMIRDSGAACVLAREGMSGRLVKLSPAEVRIESLADVRSEAARAPYAPPEAQPSSPRQLAYVIYTSGSTGEPKGVMVSHRVLVNCLASMSRVPGLH